MYIRICLKNFSDKTYCVNSGGWITNPCSTYKQFICHLTFHETCSQEKKLPFLYPWIIRLQLLHQTFVASKQKAGIERNTCRETFYYGQGTDHPWKRVKQAKVWKYMYMYCSTPEKEPWIFPAKEPEMRNKMKDSHLTYPYAFLWNIREVNKAI